jgi:UDP-N-acetylmuramoyl-L-alanyl-D-glutamate--2,6-diaminopimelate ligase
MLFVTSYPPASSRARLTPMGTLAGVPEPAVDSEHTAGAQRSVPGAAEGLSDHPRPAHTVPRRLAELAGWLGVQVPLDADETVLTGVTLDSRNVRPGDLYAGLPGANQHGARFAAQAVRAGAVAVLTDPAGASLMTAGVPVLVVKDPRARLGEVARAVYGDPGLQVLGIAVPAW